MRPHYFDFERYHWRGTYRPAGERSACQAFLLLLQAAISLARRWAKRVRDRHELAGLDYRMQRDIGVTPSEIASECQKPFWQA